MLLLIFLGICLIMDKIINLMVTASIRVFKLLSSVTNLGFARGVISTPTRMPLRHYVILNTVCLPYILCVLEYG